MVVEISEFTYARNFVVGDGVTLYTDDPRPITELAYRWAPSLGSWTDAIEYYGIRAAAGIGITRRIIADTIVINGTLTSRGLGGAGTMTRGYGQTACNQAYSKYNGNIGEHGNISSAGGGGIGQYTSQYGYTYGCAGLGGGGASLYSYAVSGGAAGSTIVFCDWWTGECYTDPNGQPGSNIGYGALTNVLMISPYKLAEIPLHGAGGGSGGVGEDALNLWNIWGGGGGRDGGGIVIICKRLIMNNGVIDASGDSGSASINPKGGGGGGGGAGGIIIYCNSIEGSGIIRAVGGQGGPGGGGGGFSGGKGGDGWVMIVASYISPGNNIDVGNGYKLAIILP